MDEVGAIGCKSLRYGSAGREAEDSDGSLEHIFDRCGVVGRGSAIVVSGASPTIRLIL